MRGRVGWVVAVALGALASAGCKDGETDSFRVDLSALPRGAKIWLGDKEIATRGKTPVVQITVPTRDLIDGKTGLVARYLGPCGPQEVKLEIDPREWTGDRERRPRGKGPPAESNAMTPKISPDPRLTDLRIDRSGARNKTLTVGALQLERQRNKVRIPWPSCAEGRTVKVGGKEIGTLPESPPAAPLRVVISVSPDQCYRLSKVEYSAERKLIGREEVKVLEEEQVFITQAPEFFLTPATPRLKGKRHTAQTFYELTRVKCGEQPSTAEAADGGVPSGDGGAG